MHLTRRLNTTTLQKRTKHKLHGSPKVSHALLHSPASSPSTGSAVQMLAQDRVVYQRPMAHKKSRDAGAHRRNDGSTLSSTTLHCLTPSWSIRCPGLCRTFATIKQGAHPIAHKHRFCPQMRHRHLPHAPNTAGHARQGAKSCFIALTTPKTRTKKGGVTMT